MKSPRLFLLISIAVAFLTACSSSVVEPEPTPVQLPAAIPEEPVVQESEPAPIEVAKPGETTVEQPSANQAQALWPDGEVQLDQQGFVEVAVTPLNLNAPDETLNFSVTLNTHSVDLSMDLAPLATLEADNGLDVQAISWDGPPGGHHVSGTLSFPAAADGASLLEGASQLTLKIRDVDAPERSFTWNPTG